MPIMNGGQALIQALHKEGVRIVFGLPGAGQYEAIDALYNHREMQYVSVRHEQAVGYMADGYSRLSGQPGVGLVVQGPGFFNTTAALATAFATSSPVLMITGAHHRAHDASVPDYDGLKHHLPFCKWAGRAASPSEIPGVIHEAFRQLKTGRPRPVVVEIASTTFAAQGEVHTLEFEHYPPPAPDTAQLDRIAGLLAESRRPVIVAGAGVHHAGATGALQKLAEHLQAPVVTSRSGKGALSDRHPLSLGSAELRFKPLGDYLETRDVLLTVGTGMNLGDHGRQTVIRIDHDAAEIVGSHPHSVGITGDARICLEKLNTRIAAMFPPRSGETAEQIRRINTLRFGSEEQLEPQSGFMAAIRSAMPDDGVLVAGMNQMGYYSRSYFPIYDGGRFLTCSSHGTLGSVYPIALGAKMARPDRAVVSVSGDGGFLYNVQELATAVQYQIGVVALVFNDSAYGNVLRAQMEQFGGRVIGTELHNPDFAAMAEVFGAGGIKVSEKEALKDALRTAINRNEPTLIEIPVGPMQRRY